MQCLHRRFNVHYIPRGGNYFDVNAGIITIQNVVFPTRKPSATTSLNRRRVKFTFCLSNVEGFNVFNDS